MVQVEVSPLLDAVAISYVHVRARGRSSSRDSVYCETPRPASTSKIKTPRGRRRQDRMASQPVGSSSTGTNFIEILSFVRGVHAYKDAWEPRVGEVLLLQREPDNGEDKLAVAVLKSGRVVGHAPKNLAPVFSPFLRRSCNKAVVQITGERVNRGAGYGLEAPCVYCLFGPDTFLQRVRELLRGAVPLAESPDEIQTQPV